VCKQFTICATWYWKNNMVYRLDIVYTHAKWSRNTSTDSVCVGWKQRACMSAVSTNIICLHILTCYVLYITSIVKFIRLASQDIHYNLNFMQLFILVLIVLYSNCSIKYSHIYPFVVWLRRSALMLLLANLATHDAPIYHNIIHYFISLPYFFCFKDMVYKRYIRLNIFLVIACPV